LYPSSEIKKSGITLRCRAHLIGLASSFTDGDSIVKRFFLIGFLVAVLAGCAQERPLSSYDDTGLCTLKGQAMGYGNTDIIPKIQAEFSRRGKLSISQADCDTYVQTGQQDARVKMKTSDSIIQQSNQTMTINAIKGY